MRHVDVGDATLHVEAEGPADRPKVVFVNSLGSDLRIWDDVVVALGKASIGALRYDLRGHGLSDLGSPPRLIDDHVSDLAAVMDRMGIARSTICGISVGGEIALGLSQRYPEKVARLVLCCTGAKIGTVESWNERIGEVEKCGVAAIVEAVLQRWFPPAAYRNGGGVLALARNMLSRTPTAGYVATCIALRELRPDRRRPRGACSDALHRGRGGWRDAARDGALVECARRRLRVHRDRRCGASALPAEAGRALGAYPRLSDRRQSGRPVGALAATFAPRQRRETSAAPRKPGTPKTAQTAALPDDRRDTDKVLHGSYSVLDRAKTAGLCFISAASDPNVVNEAQFPVAKTNGKL